MGKASRHSEGGYKKQGRVDLLSITSVTWMKQMLGRNGSS